MNRYNRAIIAFAILLSGLALIPQVNLFAETVSWQRYVGIYETPIPTVTNTPTATPGTPEVTNTATATIMPEVTNTATATIMPEVTNTATATIMPEVTNTSTPVSTSTETTVNPETGGTLNSPDGMVTLTFPEGAVNENITITYTEQENPTEETGSLLFVNTSFNVTAADQDGNPVTNFEQAFTLTINYQDSDWQNAGLEDESYLNIYWWNGSDWIGVLPCVGCVHDPENNYITIMLDHLTEFALLADDGPPMADLYLPLIRR